MVTHMKTTVELSNALLQEAKRVSKATGLTLRALMEEGLSVALGRHRSQKKFKLRDASVTGKGLRVGMQGLSWQEIRALSYGDRE